MQLHYLESSAYITGLAIVFVSSPIVASSMWESLVLPASGMADTADARSTSSFDLSLFQRPVAIGMGLPTALIGLQTMH